MPALTKTADRRQVPHARWLIGRMSEHRELTLRLSEHPDLLVIEADPLSGTSAILALALDEVARPAVSVDARGAGDAMDLAMAIAAATIEELAPAAASWWNDTGQLDAEGLRLSRALSERQIDLRGVQDGSGEGLHRLHDSLELVAVLGDARVLLVIDHLDTLLERVSAPDARKLLSVLRAEHQRLGSAQLLLVGLTDGRLVTAMRDPDHPLYRAGDILPMRRPKPQRFVDDMAVGRPLTPLPVPLIGAAAELTAGASPYLWRIADLAEATETEPRDGAISAWRLLREVTAPAMAEQFGLLGSVHRSAPTVASAIALGLGPYELPVNPKSVNDALRRMRARGVVFSPEERRWSVSDPMLASWARENAPVWVRRRARRKS